MTSISRAIFTTRVSRICSEFKTKIRPGKTYENTVVLDNDGIRSFYTCMVCVNNRFASQHHVGDDMGHQAQLRREAE